MGLESAPGAISAPAIAPAAPSLGEIGGGIAHGLFSVSISGPESFGPVHTITPVSLEAPVTNSSIFSLPHLDVLQFNFSQRETWVREVADPQFDSPQVEVPKAKTIPEVSPHPQPFRSFDIINPVLRPLPLFLPVANSLDDEDKDEKTVPQPVNETLHKADYFITEYNSAQVEQFNSTREANQPFPLSFFGRIDLSLKGEDQGVKAQVVNKDSVAADEVSSSILTEIKTDVQPQGAGHTLLNESTGSKVYIEEEIELVGKELPETEQSAQEREEIKVIKVISEQSSQAQFETDYRATQVRVSRVLEVLDKQVERVDVAEVIKVLDPSRKDLWGELGKEVGRDGTIKAATREISTQVSPENDRENIVAQIVEIINDNAAVKVGNGGEAADYENVKNTLEQKDEPTSYIVHLARKRAESKKPVKATIYKEVSLGNITTTSISDTRQELIVGNFGNSVTVVDVSHEEIIHKGERVTTTVPVDIFNKRAAALNKSVPLEAKDLAA